MVAEEVRNLAENLASSTPDISGLLDQAAEEATEAMSMAKDLNEGRDCS